MNSTGLIQDTAVSAKEEMASRCKTLSLPTWLFDRNGSVAVSPTGWGPADLWLRSPLLAKWVEQALAECGRAAASKAHELFPGAWLIPLCDLDAGGRSANMVAMAISLEMFESEQFLAICGATRLDARITQAALSPLARYQRGDLDRLSNTLRWMHGDLIVADERRTAIDAFSQQLMDTYEQIGLLYKLSGAIHQFDDPARFAMLAIELLYDTLDFEWVAAVFTTRKNPVESLNNVVIVQGDSPCDQKRLRALAIQLANDSSIDNTTRIFEPSEHELARICDDEIVVGWVVSGKEVVGMVLAGNKRGVDPDVSSIDTQLIDATTEYLGSFMHSAAAYNEQRSMFLGTIRAITSTIEAKDRYTRGHSDRVAYLAVQLGRVSGLTEQECIRVRLAGMLHDAGKIGVPESVLCKPGKLTNEEFELVKRHPVIGYNILKDIAPLHDILPGVLYHHERWDGTGYPQGLAGEQIPMLGRLLAVADMFDAMSSDRAYRSKLDRKMVLEEVELRGGTQLDPELAKLFVSLDLTEYDRMIEKHLSQDSVQVY